VASRRTTSDASRDKAAAHVALLRGINVGGRNMLPMADLSRMFTRAGCARVQTYIQSGNVVFSPSVSLSAEDVVSAVAGEIVRRFAFQPAIIVRSAADMMRVASRNPLLVPGVDLALLHVGFFDRAPSGRLVKQLDPDRSPGDRFIVRGSEIFLHLRNGMGKTRLTNAYIDSTLQATCTMRNWRTVLTLADMAQVMSAAPSEQ
jgi:uncharacterized protein (DUF1697 family)